MLSAKAVDAVGRGAGVGAYDSPGVVGAGVGAYDSTGVENSKLSELPKTSVS